MADEKEPPKFRLRVYPDEEPPRQEAHRPRRPAPVEEELPEEELPEEELPEEDEELPPARAKPKPKPPAADMAGGFSGLVASIARWIMGIETWTRAFIALMLGGAIFTGYLIYLNQARFFDTLEDITRHRLPARIVRMVFRHDLDVICERLLKSLTPNAVAVTIWSVAIVENKQVLETDHVIDELKPLARQYESTRWASPLPFFGANPKVNLLLVSLLRGRFACDASRELWSIIQNLPQMQEVCVIGIPPYAPPLAGFIAVAFHTTMTDAERERIRFVMAAAADSAVQKPGR